MCGNGHRRRVRSWDYWQCRQRFGHLRRCVRHVRLFEFREAEPSDGNERCHTCGDRSRATERPTAEATERVGHLREETRRDIAARHAVDFRSYVGGHVKRAPQQIEEREGWRKVSVHAFVGGGVVPTMEHGAGEQVLERAERPVQVRVNHHRVREIDRPEDRERQRREAHQQDDGIGECELEDRVHRVESLR